MSLIMIWLIVAFVAIGILAIAVVTGLLWLSMRIELLEGKQSDGPSHKDLAAIRDRIADMSGHMSALASQQQASTQAIQTIQKHLMESDP